MDEEEMVSVSIMQHGMHFSMRIPKTVADMMPVVAGDNPEVWRDREFDLLKLATEAVEKQEAESQPQSQPQPESQEQ